MAPTLAEAVEVARGKAFVIRDGTLLRIDRVGMASGRDRAFYSENTKPMARTCRSSPTQWDVWCGSHRRCPGGTTRHGRGSRARIVDALNDAGVQAIADTAYQGGGAAIRVPQRRRRLDPDTGRYRPLSVSQKQVNTAHARQRGPGERVNAELKNWRILHKIRSCPSRASSLLPQFRPS
jgi:hypothetical protein